MGSASGRRLAPILGAAVACVGALFCATSPSRASEPTAVVIVDGPGGDAIADQLTKDKLGGLAATARKPKSVPCKLGAAKGPKGKAKTALDACLRKTVDADAIVLVVVTKGPKGRVVDIRVVPHQGEVTEARVTLPAKASATDTDKVKAPIEPALAPYAATATTTSTTSTTSSTTEPTTTTVASGAPSAVATTEEAAKPPASKVDDGAPRPNAPRVAVAFGVGAGTRSFSFRGGSGPTLRPYSLNGALLFGIAAEAYPGDDGEGVRFRPGLAFAYVTTSGLSSETDLGRTIGSTWTRVDIGVRGRLALGGAKAPVFALGVGWSREAFVFTEADLSLPSAAYSTWRASLDGRVPLGPVAILVGAAVMPGVRMSGVTDIYRNRSLLGLEGIIGAALPFARNFEARLIASHTRYSAKFVAAPGATVVATGTTDSYSRLQVLLAILY